MQVHWLSPTVVSGVARTSHHQRRQHGDLHLSFSRHIVFVNSIEKCRLQHAWNQCIQELKCIEDQKYDFEAIRLVFDCDADFATSGLRRYQRAHNASSTCFPRFCIGSSLPVLCFNSDRIARCHVTHSSQIATMANAFLEADDLIPVIGLTMRSWRIETLTESFFQVCYFKSGGSPFHIQDRNGACCLFD
jgi:hypothetical protein